MTKPKTLKNAKIITIYMEADEWSQFCKKYKSASAKIREWIVADLHQVEDLDEDIKKQNEGEEY